MSRARPTCPQIVPTNDQLDRLAEQIVERLTNVDGRPRRKGSLVDAREVAFALGVSRDYVYAHREELGGERIGQGPRGRLRFDLDRALSTSISRSVSEGSPATDPPAVVKAGQSGPPPNGQRRGPAAHSSPSTPGFRLAG